MDETMLRQTLDRYTFYHVIPLTPTISTPGWAHPGVLRTQAMVSRVLHSLDLKGKRVLDIGCRDGLFSFEAEKLGASDVVAIDNDLSMAAVEFLIPYFKSKVTMRKMNLYDLTAEDFGTFDVVICLGVLYHLRFPFWGLKRMIDVVAPSGQLVIETAFRVDDNRDALLYCPIGMDSPYEPTSCTFYNQKGLADTLTSLGMSVRTETYVWNYGRDWVTPRATIRRRLRTLLGKATPHPIDRGVFVCSRALIDSSIAVPEELQYWFGTHRIHTDSLVAERQRGTTAKFQNPAAPDHSSNHG